MPYYLALDRCLIIVGMIALGCAAISPAQALAQSPSVLPDSVRQLTERVDALERENSATQAENARLQSFIRGRFPDFTQGQVPTTGMPGVTQTASASLFQEPAGQTTLNSGCQPENPIERLGTRYDNGFVLMESADPERTPFRLVVGNFAQIRFTNTQLDSLTFVDHLGNVRPVDPRNDISFNRDLLTFSGYAFVPTLSTTSSSGPRGRLLPLSWLEESPTSSPRPSF